MRWCRRRVQPLPATDNDLSDVIDTLTQIRRSLETSRPEREAARETARQARETAEELVTRNHFGESIQKAMERRR